MEQKAKKDCFDKVKWNANDIKRNEEARLPSHLSQIYTSASFSSSAT
jgi:hypothetical protein